MELKPLTLTIKDRKKDPPIIYDLPQIFDPDNDDFTVDFDL